MPSDAALPRAAPGRLVDVVKWGASVAQIGGYAATGLNWTPWNLPLFVIGILGWLAVGILWRDRALVLVHLVAFAALTIGYVTQ
ncbi:DUF6552 family protein [Tropicibacter oceani]|uniref:Ubiquinone biosynthesis methyltransferase UbiE n=1 Tax=Tropicibacter oceani TaxID=3058420 RepID=A0ABY8QDK4_9RHOB|nr:DUF6552 family protein [Tropicibacter oceani]WGW02714.1 ubiquinone biosynthesis methyltransferase UbiE [Tropicibacter oceani]